MRKSQGRSARLRAQVGDRPPAWPRQILDEAAADRIGNLHENDRDRTVYLLKRSERRIALNQNDSGIKPTNSAA
jgi:hypothetical protein